jgi:predicted Zn finger-like uncharacterized protein
MIIACINCNKKFNVDSKLIPPEGRKIQCGSCKHIWLYKIEEATSSPYVLDDNKALLAKNIDNNKITANSENLDDDKRSTISNAKININQNANIKKTENKSVSNFFSYLLVIIISFIALLVLIDTLKTPLINIFPQLEVILFNIFETLKDVKLFIIDLT